MEKENKDISSDRNKKWLLWISVTITVIILFQICYGLRILQPSNINWLMSARHDWGTHYLGWAFYKNEPWHFPLGKITGYNYPVGTNVGFTDSIPLLAIFFKLFAPLLSDDFQYFGIWLFLCQLLAAYFTILLFGLFKVNRIITLAAVIFIVINPVLVYRGMHPALCGQWLIIASIYVYFLNPLTTKTKKILLYQFILLAVSALINPYLCAMVLGFTFAIPAKLYFFDKVLWKKYFFGYVAVFLFSMVLLWYMTGLIEFGKKEDLGVSGSYGLYGMNLNSLYNSVGYSSILPEIKRVSWHQYEGYMYLGVGMLLLIFILLVYYCFIFIYRRINKEKAPEAITTGNKRFIPLLVLACLYALFSITLVFTFNDKVLFRIPAPSLLIHIEEVFRASARFFWMPYYLIIFFTLIGLAKSKIMPLFTSILIVLSLVIQLYDIRILLTSRDDMAYGTYTPPMDKNWIKLMSLFDEILFFPPFDSPKIRSMDYQDFSYLALKAGKPVNLAYLAREDSHAMQLYGDNLTAIVESGRLSPKTLYITSAPYLEHFSQAFESNTASLNILDSAYYIFSKSLKNEELDILTRRLNALHKKELDSALSMMGNKTQFTEIKEKPGPDNTSLHFNVESGNMGQKIISMSGWALIDPAQNNKGDSVFIVLSSDDKSYIARAKMSQREDIVKIFPRPDLYEAGFKILANTDDVEKGKYMVILAIKNAEGHFVFHSTGKKINVKISDYATPEKIVQLPAAGKIVYDINIGNGEYEFSAGGWAVLENHDANGYRVSLILKNNENIYMCATEPVLRPDVTANFKNKYRLDSSGYTVKILKNTVAKGKYELGLLIKDTRQRTESIIFTGNEIDIH